MSKRIKKQELAAARAKQDRRIAVSREFGEYAATATTIGMAVAVGAAATALTASAANSVAEARYNSKARKAADKAAERFAAEEQDTTVES